ncbi:Bsu YqfO NIF3/CutA domain [hydrothermal vent metagenome]|uniref:Bsu YqfO NIF3/CutA domain n=1 Tax=hydrothermal vent metagenome TaxID=652676 RepID=A0A3B0YDS2_9ZZZZ
MYKLSIFIPESHLEQVKTALFKAGAGKIGNYDCCSWQTPGQGQFRPLENSRPFSGKPGQINTVDEYKLEVVIADHRVKDVITAMKQAHPYEEPAYDCWQLAEI